MEKISVTVDKSHLITIGERLYTENVELLRELINNSYDADATEVKVTISDDEVIVEDDGMGMDMDGLKQYFNIGSPFKKENPKSPKFGRFRIGEFGIGKFSVLSNCDNFEVFTKKGNFAGRVVFNKGEWEKDRDHWQLPFFQEIPDDKHDGTKVILRGLKKKFDIETVEKRLIETLPLKVPNFFVYINGKKLIPHILTGRKIPFLEGTVFGIVHGEILIVPASHLQAEDAGVLVRVKQVAVNRMSFGLPPDLLSRVSGEVNADFLKLTTDRNDFIRDVPEYEEFLKVMEKIMQQIKNEIETQKDEKENNRVKRAIKEVTKKIEEALLKNKDWAPPGLLPFTDEQKKKNTNLDGEIKKGETKVERKRVKRPHLKQVNPNAFIKKIKIGRMNLALIIDHFGTDGPESFIESDIIYINRDHPLYVRESVNRERHIMNIARLICQEISLMSKPKNPRHAYERQSKLLKDAFIK
ncbi:MAG: ATP-binding protein [Candidatus Goldbacteria bacterium]|nr:ATP-binding protein [Candidatus Goldiibacteriota bacterium]